MTRGGERGLWGNKNEPQLSLNIPPGQMGQVCKNSLPVDKLWFPGPPCRFLFRDPPGKCTQSSGASSLRKPFIPKNTHLAALGSRRQLYAAYLYPRRDTLSTPTAHGAFFLLLSSILLTWVLRQLSAVPGEQWFSNVGFRVTWRAH